uniref:Uncharacterized protein n=1 Tax=Fagus sylvatica TaxID=28930 RepID=A0A2N9IQ52_FAGSY
MVELSCAATCRDWTDRLCSEPGSLAFPEPDLASFRNRNLGPSKELAIRNLEIVSKESITEIYKSNFEFNSVEPPWPEIHQEPSDWVGRDEIIPASIERKANSVDLPLSLRIIKRKMQWQDGFREVGESALTH